MSSKNSVYKIYKINDVWKYTFNKDALNNNLTFDSFESAFNYVKKQIIMISGLPGVGSIHVFKEEDGQSVEWFHVAR